MRLIALCSIAVGCGPVQATVIPSTPITDDEPDDCPYEGNWPCIPEAEDLLEPSLQPFQLGARVPRLRGIDQFGDRVDLYDFAGEELIVVVNCTAWVTQCQQASGWLDGERNGYSQRYPRMASAVAGARVRVIMVLSEDLHGEPADSTLVESWYTMWPVPRVPILADPERRIDAWLPSPILPSAALLDADLRVALDSDDFTDVFDEVQARLQD